MRARADGPCASAVFAILIALLLPAGLLPSRIPSSFGDLVSYHYPLRHLVATALQCGRLPFWNPYFFTGLPLSANPQSVLFYPPALLGNLFPLTLALSWDAWLHLCWAALGAALLARKAGLAPLAGWALGAVYALSPFLVYRVAEGIPTLLASLSWAPWCWLFWLYGARGWLGAAWALQLLSGHPQFFVVNALGLGLWTAVSHPRRLAALVLEASLAALLSPLCWAPLLEFLGQSVRKIWSPQFSLGYSVGLREFVTWISPGSLGDPLRKTWGDVPSVFFETTGVFLGLTTLALSLRGLCSRRAAALWALIAAGLLLAAGSNNPAYPWLLAHTPLGFLRTPSRALFLPLWALWLAAGQGWRAWARRPGARYYLAAGAAFAVLQLLVWDAPFLRAVDARPYLAVNPTLAQQMGGAPFRILGDPGLANQNKAALYRAMNVNGYEAFYLAGYPLYAARSEGKPAADASRTYLSRGDTPEMRRLGVGYRLSLEGKLEKAGARGSLPLAYFVDGRGEPVEKGLRLTLAGPERWEIAGRWPLESSALVLSQSDYPGWRAWDNGSPSAISRYDGLLQKVARPVGENGFSLVAVYEPRRWGALAAAAAAGWALLAGLAAKRSL